MNNFNISKATYSTVDLNFFLHFSIELLESVEMYMQHFEHNGYCVLQLLLLLLLLII